MKSRSSFFRRLFAGGLIWAVAGIGAVAYAQAPPPPSTAPQPAAPVLSPQQLDDLVAPIALYPDPLLGQVLAASTYPLEIVEAQQWLQKNSGLTGTALMDAARQQNWDPSVQALVAFPNVLTELNQDVRWTTDLGNAFLAQQGDVMSAVQRMRASARANGKLNSSPQQTVTTETQNGQSAIQIQPADPQVIYVPTYDPAYIWGPPLYGGYYPSLLYPDYGFGFWPGFNVGLYFGGWGFGGCGWGGWGWGPNWFGHGVFVNNAFFGHYGFRGGFGGFAGRGAWAHDPSHRLGVGYSNRALSQRYGAASRASAARMGSRFNGGSSFAANRGGTYRGSQFSSQNGARSQFGARYNAPSQGFRGNSVQNGARGFQNGGRSFQSRGTTQSAPRYSAPAQRFGGASRSFSGGGATRSFSGGGAARSFGGGGHSFSGGGGHSGGGGGHSGGGGHGGHR